MALTPIEIGIMFRILDRGGCVLDFTRASLDDFVASYVGVMPCDQYELPMMKSLKACVSDLPDREKVTLFIALLEYYEVHFERELVRDEACDFDHHHGEDYLALYKRAKSALERERAGSNPFTAPSEYLKEQFSTEYMTSQIDSLMKMRETNPTDAIGKAKELVESCCRTILKETGVEVPNSWDMNDLIKATKKKLDIDTESVSSNLPEAQTVKRILGSLTGLVGGIAEYRNSWGSGHGKASDFEPLFVRHAKLAVGSSITLVEYLWDTYLWRKDSGRLS